MDNFRRSLMDAGGKPTDPSMAAPLEVAFYNSASDSIVIRKQKDWVDGETPIGIVVVPGYHNRYGDGSCGIMSLVGMDINHPESGEPVTGATQTDGVNVLWGQYNYLVGNNIFKSTTALTGASDYIPYQSYSNSTDCSARPGALVWPYAGTTTAPTSSASTAYTNTDGYVTATSDKSGCDFNGIRNTVACYVKTRTAALWTASTVPNSNGATNTPAAACCGRFKTVGTNSFLDVFRGTTSNDLNYGTSTSTKDNKGFWYLPAEGELCYLPSKRFEINKIILALNQKYGNVGTQLSNIYLSSSEYNGSDVWVMTMTYGTVGHTQKSNGRYVRAFMTL